MRQALARESRAAAEESASASEELNAQAAELNVMVGKEITFVGSQRFDMEFADAVGLIGSGAIDPRPMITATYPVTEALAAFRAASDRAQSVKVQLSFADA